MAELVYILCAATSLCCAALLLRGYLRSRSHLLLWSSLCFIGLAVNNLILVVDLMLVPELELGVWRSLAALGGISVLVFGLIWEVGL